MNSVAVQQDNKVIVASNNGLKRYNPDGSVDSSFNTGTINNWVKDVAILPDGKIIIAGFFTSVNGVTRNRIARLDTNGSVDTNFDTVVGANSYINSIALHNDGKIIIGGNFTMFDGSTRARVARVNSDGSLDSTFDPGTGASGVVNKTLIQENGKILIGGGFDSFAGVNRSKLARLFPNGSLDSNFGAGLDWSGSGMGADISALIQKNNKLVIGGNFSIINDQKLSGLSQLLLDGKSASFDFDGDGMTDIGIFRPAAGEWWILRSSDSSVPAVRFGTATDRPVPADFTGDGKTDVAFFRESTGEWFILRSEDASFYAFPFGTTGDIPAPGDYDADGKSDAAVFRPSNATWYILRSSDGGITIQQFGISEDKPVVADYDGDGRSDIAVFRPSVSEWWILRSTLGLQAVQFGQTGDKTAAGDYTGDGKADVAFWRPSTGQWFILRSEDNSFYAFPFGSSGDIPTPGDYDGDGRWDAAVFRPANAVWYLQRTTSGFTAIQFGADGDLPIPNAYVRN